MYSVDDLFDDLWGTPIGRSFICNFLDGIRWEIIEKSDAKVFSNDWISNIIGSTGNALDTLDYVVSSLGMTLDSKIGPAGLPNAIATSFSCKYLPASLRTSPTSGMIRAADLIEQHGHATTNRERYAIQNELFAEIEARSGGDRDGLIEFELLSNIAGPMPFAWFTSHNDGDLEESCWRNRYEWSKRPDLTRDALGLIHRGSTPAPPFARQPELMGVFVVERTSVPLGTRFCRPNCLDAGSHSRFKCGFGNLAKRPYGWGRALDLEKMLGKRPHRGGREIVVENFAPSTRIKFTVLGEVMVPRSDFLGSNDDKYEASVRRKRERNSLKRRFQEVLK